MEVMKNKKSTKGSLTKGYLLWVIIIGIFFLGVYLNLRYQMASSVVRLSVGLLFFGLMVLIASFTSQGKRFFIFVKEAKGELVKVSWPAKDETMKVTLMVSVLVVVASLILWLIDSLLVKLIGWFTKV